MTGIGLGAAAFIVLFWVDLVSLRGLRLVKPILWLASGTLFVVAAVDIVRHSPRLTIPTPLSALGWVLAAASFLLLVYSLFFEIPFVSAYIMKGSPARLVTRGTYALCRHPGVLWLGGLLAGLFLIRGSLWMLAAIPVWIGLDIVYVVLQERLFFVTMFGSEYLDYQRKVPMLLPTRRSIMECTQTIFRKKVA